MKRIVLTAFMAGVVAMAGALSGLAGFWIAAGAALAGGFGWMLGGLPSGPSQSSGPGDSSGEVTAASDSGGDGGGGGE
jgi:hypothetical protein